jgi:hypothetical protein
MVQCFPAKGVHFVPVLYGHEINIKTQINILVLCFPILFQYYPKHNIIMQTLHLVSVFAFSTTPNRQSICNKKPWRESGSRRRRLTGIFLC